MPAQSILIVDDEPIVRDSISDWLKHAGYGVATAENARQALDMVQANDFKVIVLDMRLLGDSGIDVLKEVKKQRPEIKSIIITAYPSVETAVEAMKLGAVDYLVKPFAPDDLQRRIEETLASVMEKPGVKEVAEAPLAKAIEVRKSFAITGSHLRAMLSRLATERKMELIGVKVKDGRYVFGRLTKLDELCLDYDVTVLPPTKYLLPEKETLLKFQLGEEAGTEPVTEAVPRVLVGVHPYDIRAIELLDEVFIATNPDPNYIARRQNIIIIGIDCLHPSPKSFASSMGTNQTEDGYDLFLTDIGGDEYIIAIGSEKGALIASEYAEVTEPTGKQLTRQKAVRDKAAARYQLSLSIPKEKLPKLLEDSYDSDYWGERSKTCLSCGSCVMVCPTCFCFDVKDEVALNLKEGERFRQWDGCMLADFAKVATGENFRHDKASRFRHRIYRKGKYVLERYGRLGCVGCGRCAIACLANIASPLEAFNALAEEARMKAPTRRLGEERPEKELYNPQPAELVKVTELTPREKLFEVRLLSGKPLGHQPGQFIEVSVSGFGEAPFGVASSPTRGDTFQFAVRRVGDITSALHNMKAGDRIGIRGPFGRGFPIKALEGRDVLLVAGGIGLFPVRSLVQYILDKRQSFNQVTLLFGARSPAERLFTDELAQWSTSKELEFHETVDRGDDTWKGNVGVITTLIPRVKTDPARTKAVVVGPPIMYRFVIAELKKKDLPDDSIILSLERRMKCGVGKCGHCQINGVYVCQEGPVFTLAQLRNLREAV